MNVYNETLSASTLGYAYAPPFLSAGRRLRSLHLLTNLLAATLLAAPLSGQNFAAPEPRPSSSPTMFAVSLEKQSGAATPTATTAPRVDLTLEQAIHMALENNLDLQLQQIDQTPTALGEQRAKGGGTPTAVNYSIAEVPAGVGVAALPLNTSVAAFPAGVGASGIVASPSYDTGRVLEASHTLSLSGGSYSAGSVIPAFDLTLLGQFAWLHRDPDNSITTAAAASTPSDTVTTNNTLGNVTVAKGFSLGTNVQLGINNFVQSFYSGRSSAVPFTHPNAVALIAQPLLRGAGRTNNTRFIAIAKTNKQIAAMVLEQQMVSTVSGVETLYFDLVSLQNIVTVQKTALAAAQRLLSDDQQQLAVGRMPPIEIARAESLVEGTRLALTQSEARREQQANILRSVLDPQSLTAAAALLPDVVATDTLVPDEDLTGQPLAELIHTALASRPDLRQSRLQVKNGERAVAGSSNARRPEVDLFGSFQSRGVIIPSLVPVGNDPLTGAPLLNAVPTGGQRSSRVFEAGIQFNLPVQNRVAEANLGTDRAELRHEQLRLAQVESQAGAEVRNALIGVAAAKEAAQASAKSREVQQKLLDAETEKFRSGYSSNFAIIQQQSFLAQAEATEVAANAAWKKAEVQLERALGQTLARNHIEPPAEAKAGQASPQLATHR